MPVDEWVRTKVTGWQGDAVRELLGLVHEAAPEAAVSIKWGQPVVELGGPFAFVRPAKEHVTLGFWRGSELKDPRGLLQGEGDRMKHIKITAGAAIDRPGLSTFVKEAVALNAAKGDPTKG